MIIFDTFIFFVIFFLMIRRPPRPRPTATHLPSTRVFRSFDPTASNYGSDYSEGNAWQYSWFMPDDEGGLIRELGGDDATVKKLDAMFEFDNSKLDYSHAEDIAGLIGQYIHGTEPSHHVDYMYNYEIGREKV